MTTIQILNAMLLVALPVVIVLNLRAQHRLSGLMDRQKRALDELEAQLNMTDRRGAALVSTEQATASVSEAVSALAEGFRGGRHD